MILIQTHNINLTYQCEQQSQSADPSDKFFLNLAGWTNFSADIQISWILRKLQNLAENMADRANTPDIKNKHYNVYVQSFWYGTDCQFLSICTRKLLNAWNADYSLVLNSSVHCKSKIKFNSQHWMNLKYYNE